MSKTAAKVRRKNLLCNNLHTFYTSPPIYVSIADYFKTQPVVKAWIFGSFVRGKETPLSDVDLLVK